jgi:hypothetical protein
MTISVALKFSSSGYDSRSWLNWLETGMSCVNSSEPSLQQPLVTNMPLAPIMMEALTGQIHNRCSIINHNATFLFQE